MKFIDSGEGKVPLISAIAILAISLTVNLPGLAISPVLGKLKEVFHSTALEAQLLNVLPNLMTIPFILYAGKICNPKNQLTVLTIGLLIFTATGVGYFFAKSMIIMIILSCLLGVGIGLVIPLAASLISQNFSGKPRGIVLGAKSGLSNLSLIIATLFVGWVAGKDWHLAFAVYFIPLVPLVMVPFIKNKFINQARKAPEVLTSSKDSQDQNFHFKGKTASDMMWFALIIYFIITYGALVISYYLPFTMASYGLSTSKVGVATSMFYLAATIAGFGLSKVIRVTGIWTFQIALIVVALSLLGVGFIHTYASYILGVFLIGLGYGVIQPILYDKTSYFAPTDAKSTEYFAILLTSSYVALSCIPFIVEFFGTFIKGNTDPSFPFILNGVILAILAIVVVVKHKSFVVQAGVIPQGAGIVKQPSSVIDPVTRYVATSLEDNRQKVRGNNEESAIEESEAPVATSPINLGNSPAPSDVESSIAIIPPANATAPIANPTTAFTDDTKPLTPAAHSPEHTAQIMQQAENSLAEARDSLHEMRMKQAAMLRFEAAQIDAKASELHREALELLDEADALEANNPPTSDKTSGNAPKPSEPAQEPTNSASGQKPSDPSQNSDRPDPNKPDSSNS